MADEVRFELRRGRGVLLTLPSAGMAALSVLLVSAAVAPHWLGGFTAGNPVVWLVCLVGGTAGVLFFGFTTIAWLTVVLRQDAGLVMDADGLTDRSSFISAGRITWDQVTSWHVWEMQRQKNLCLVVTDPESVLARMSPPGTPAQPRQRQPRRHARVYWAEQPDGEPRRDRRGGPGAARRLDPGARRVKTWPRVP